MKQKNCHICGKEKLTKDEIGLSKKILDLKTKHFYCFSCLAEYLEVDPEFLQAKLEEFKDQGCTEF